MSSSSTYKINTDFSRNRIDVRNTIVTVSVIGLIAATPVVLNVTSQERTMDKLNYSNSNAFAVLPAISQIVDFEEPMANFKSLSTVKASSSVSVAHQTYFDDIDDDIFSEV